MPFGCEMPRNRAVAEKGAAEIRSVSSTILFHSRKAQTAALQACTAVISDAGGWGGIRTHETLARLPVFKTGALNRSATHPLYWFTGAWMTNAMFRRESM